MQALCAKHCYSLNVLVMRQHFFGTQIPKEDRWSHFYGVGRCFLSLSSVMLLNCCNWRCRKCGQTNLWLHDVSPSPRTTPPLCPVICYRGLGMVMATVRSVSTAADEMCTLFDVHSGQVCIETQTKKEMLFWTVSSSSRLSKYCLSKYSTICNTWTLTAQHLLWSIYPFDLWLHKKVFPQTRKQSPQTVDFRIATPRITQGKERVEDAAHFYFCSLLMK